MTIRACPKSSLVEALRDGRLGPQERASLDRHLSSCAHCAQLMRDLDRIGASLRAPRPPATPLEHQRARSALLELAALAPPSAARAPRRPIVMAFAIAAMMLAVAVGWAAGRFTAPALLAGGPGAPGETSIRPSNEASFERRAAAGLDVVTLVRGTLDVTVRPLAQGERFVVRTADAEIEVRGTAFRVEAEGGRIRGVAVSEGTVEVRYAGFSAVIPSGGSWRATGDGAAPSASASPIAVAATSVASAAPEAPPSAAPEAATSALPTAPIAMAAPNALPIAPIAPIAMAAPSASPVVGAPIARAPSAVRKVAARASTANQRPSPEPSAAPTAAAPEAPSAARAAPAIPKASQDFAAAMTALGRGDYEGSARQLETFASSHPSDARADEADYLRAVALQRAGRAADAAAAARRYLATRPGGAHRLEARQIAGN
ncbi:Fe-S oxidoreductase [Minicystis rosea]|nr:Fe-S oxidoreductase [Minicystis rosea]